MTTIKMINDKKACYLIWFVYFIFITILTYRYISLPTEKMLIVDGKYKIRDFVYYIIIIKSYLYGDINTIYNKTSHIIALNNFYGIKSAVAMPMGISPTAIFIWFPFALILELNKLYSYTIWVSFSVLAFTIAIFKLFRIAIHRNKIMVPWFLVRLLFFLFSFAMIVCIVHGQTTIMACALLIFLILEIYKAIDEKRILRPWVYIPIVFFLSIKAPYIILGLGLLIVFGYIFEFVLSMAFISVIFFMIGIWKGITLYQDWFQQLAVFNSLISSDNYMMAYIMDTVINFRSAFSIFLGSDICSFISNLFLILGMGFIFSISFVRFLYPSSLKIVTSKITPQQVAVLLVAILLLFMPYIGEYEDLLMIVLFVIGTLSIAPYESSIFRNLLIVICLCLVLNFKLFQYSNMAWLFWWMKFSVFAGIFIDLKG